MWRVLHLRCQETRVGQHSFEEGGMMEINNNAMLSSALAKGAIL